MASQSNRRQLVLMEGDRNCIQLLYDQHISQISPAWTFILFAHEGDQEGRRALRDFRDTSQIKLRRSSQPANELFRTLHVELDHYSCIHIICDEKPEYLDGLMKLYEKHKHIYLMKIDPSGITLESVLNRLQGYDAGMSNLSQVVKYKPIGVGYKCSICFETFTARNDLEKHNQERHRTDASNDEHIDDIAKEQPTGKTNLTDQYHDECYCLACGKAFRNTTYRANHIRTMHPNAEAIDNQG